MKEIPDCNPYWEPVCSALYASSAGPVGFECISCQLNVFFSLKEHLSSWALRWRSLLLPTWKACNLCCRLLAFLPGLPCNNQGLCVCEEVYNCSSTWNCHIVPFTAQPLEHTSWELNQRKKRLYLQLWKIALVWLWSDTYGSLLGVHVMEEDGFLFFSDVLLNLSLHLIIQKNWSQFFGSNTPVLSLSLQLTGEEGSLCACAELPW